MELIATVSPPVVILGGAKRTRRSLDFGKRFCNGGRGGDAIGNVITFPVQNDSHYMGGHIGSRNVVLWTGRPVYSAAPKPRLDDWTIAATVDCLYTTGLAKPGPR